MDTSSINASEDDGDTESNHSTLFSPASSREYDDTAPLNPGDFSKVYQNNLSKHSPKRFVYLFPLWLEEKFRKFDDPILRFCQTYTNKYTYYLSLGITAFVAIEIAIAAPVLLFILGQDALATEFAYLALLLALLSQVPKRFLWRFRPYMVQRAKVMKKDQTSSFPSRAVTCSVVYSYAIVWAVLYYQRGPIFQWWMPFLFIFMVLASSFARINLGVHYPSDCVGGIIQGILVCVIGTGLRKADIMGCKSCWDNSCYAPSSAYTLSFDTLGRLNFIMLAVLLILCIVIPVVSVMKPVDFWSKCDRVYGMLFPAIAFQLLMLCPRAYEQNGSLPKPNVPMWYSFVFAISLSLLATVESLTGALNEEQLMEKIKDVHVLGLRSKTKVTDKVLNEAKRLLAIGCFCIGTDQVDLAVAESRGVPVFNSPFCNSRSVAELIIAEIILLSRKLGDRNKEMHQKIWRKESKNCHEIRGKTLGIIGYGHIGSQLSVLAEAMGMNVIYYDTSRKLPLGNSKPCLDMKTLLETANFVSLHVPDTESTRNMIGEEELNTMKRGSYLLNASRGKVVVIEALAAALKSGHIAGSAVDVYPSEPEANCADWENVLQNCPNTLLTPHIGGSTEEAQEAIGLEVSDLINQFINTGASEGSVNFPEISIRYSENTHRILNIHQNRPGVLRDINNILAEFNVTSQILSTRKQIGYIIADVDKEASKEIKRLIASIPASIRTRVLY
eukprot:gene14972-17703_t